MKQKNYFEWFDDELYTARSIRDRFYKIYAKSHSSNDHQNFIQAKYEFKKLNDQKMIDYFQNKSPRDFKSSKKFWEFYSRSLVMRKNKANQHITTEIKYENEKANSN
ncbi:unnamed protein product, partial [Brachionus calyciflorus]